MTGVRVTQDARPGLTVEGLTWFLRAAEAGSLSRAAARARVSQSTVSRAIARLEAATGIVLFHRTGRAFALTDAGAELLPRAQDVLAELTAFEHAAAARAGNVMGAVRLSLCTTLGRHVLLPGLLAWAKERATVTLDVRFEEREVDPRSAGLDLVVRAGRPRDSDVHRTALGDYGHVLVASPAWVRVHGRPDSPEELAALPTVAVRLERVWSTWIFHSERGALRVETLPRVVVTDADALVDAAISGAGATVLPDYLAARALADGRLVALCTELRLPDIPVHAFHAPRRRLTRPAREALDVLVATMRKRSR